MLFAATAIMSSCVNENPEIQNPDERPLKFMIEADEPELSTKAAPVTGGLLPAPSDFGIYAYTKNGAAHTQYQDMNGKTVTAVNSTTVNLGGTYYWPVNGSLVFYCFYPTQAAAGGASVLTPASSTNPDMTLTYTVPSAFASQKDLMYAYNGSTTPGTGVSLKFYHGLTRVTVQCKVINNTNINASVKVSNVALQNVMGKGVLTVNSTGAASWTKSTKTNFDVTLTTTTGKELGKTPSNDLGPDADGGGTDGYTNVFVSTTDNSFLMIPMTNTEFGTNVSGLAVTLNVDGKIVGPYSIPLNTAKTNHEWKMGEHVNYRLTFDVSKETNPLSISSITVNPWGNQNNIDVGIN